MAVAETPARLFATTSSRSLTPVTHRLISAAGQCSTQARPLRRGQSHHSHQLLLTPDSTTSSRKARAATTAHHYLHPTQPAPLPWLPVPARPYWSGTQ